MKRNMWLELLAVTIFLVATTAAIAVSGADLALSASFCTGGTWPIGDLLPWQALYKLDRTPALLLGLVGLAGIVVSRFRPEKFRWRRPGLFLVILLLLGPGLLVNAVFKEHWGRPRPREVVQFGGKKQFHQPWQRGEDGQGRSFPSGHSSAAFYMTAPYFIYRRNNKRLSLCWLSGGLIFGVFMSIARITQGGHFLSDCLWAWGMVHLLAVLLASVLHLDQKPQSPANSYINACST
jgi:membrane-associated PAP2 superfamily phosphatase